MADAADMSGGVKEPELPHRQGNGSSLSSAERRAEAEDSTQNGCRRERSRSDEKILLGAMEDGGSLGNSHRKTSGLAAHDQLQQHQLKDGLGAALPRSPEDLPLKKNFQIPRKSKEKRGCLLVLILSPHLPSLRSFPSFSLPASHSCMQSLAGVERKRDTAGLGRSVVFITDGVGGREGVLWKVYPAVLWNGCVRKWSFGDCEKGLHVPTSPMFLPAGREDCFLWSREKMVHLFCSFCKGGGKHPPWVGWWMCCRSSCSTTSFFLSNGVGSGPQHHMLHLWKCSCGS